MRETCLSGIPSTYFYKWVYLRLLAALGKKGIQLRGCHYGIFFLFYYYISIKCTILTMFKRSSLALSAFTLLYSHTTVHLQNV